MNDKNRRPKERRSWAKNMKKWHRKMDLDNIAYLLNWAMPICSTQAAYKVYPTILKNQAGWLVYWISTLSVISFVVRR